MSHLIIMKSSCWKTRFAVLVTCRHSQDRLCSLIALTHVKTDETMPKCILAELHRQMVSVHGVAEKNTAPLKMRFLSNASRLLHHISHTGLEPFCPRFCRFSLVSLCIQRISTTSNLKLAFCNWTAFDSGKQMLHRLIVQSFLASINRRTLAIKQLTNQVFKMRTACTYTCIPSFATNYDSSADCFIRQLLPNRLLNNFQSRSVLWFRIPRALLPTRNSPADLNPGCLAATNPCQWSLGNVHLATLVFPARHEHLRPASATNCPCM